MRIEPIPPAIEEREFLSEMADENPIPAERWRGEDTWDPPFKRRVIARCERKKLVEVDRSEPSNWRIRFTPKGRVRFQEPSHDQS